MTKGLWRTDTVANLWGIGFGELTRWRIIGDGTFDCGSSLVEHLVHFKFPYYGTFFFGSSNNNNNNNNNNKNFIIVSEKKIAVITTNWGHLSKVLIINNYL